MTLQTPRAKKLSRIFLLLMTAVALYLSWKIARPFLTPILAASLLAIALFPLKDKLEIKLRNPTLTALLVTAIFLVVVLVPMVLIVNLAAHEIIQVYDQLNEKQSSEGGWTEFAKGLLDPPIDWMAQKTGVSRPELRQEAMSRLKALGAAMLGWARSLAINLGQTLIHLVTMLVTLFFFLRDGERIRDRLGELMPIEAHRYQELISTISASITANVYGVLLVAIAQGMLGAIGYLIAGLPSVVLWSIATAIVSMVPVFGSAFVWVPACAYLAIIGSWGHALFLLAWGAGVIGSADNIVRPLVLRGKVKLNTLLIFFSLLGGVEAFGVLGIFLGPIIISVSMALLRMTVEERAEWAGSSAIMS